MMSDNIIIELYKLSLNMNWLNGYALIWQLAWYGFEPWWTQAKLSFCQNFIWHEGGRAKETLAAKRG